MRFRAQRPEGNTRAQRATADFRDAFDLIDRNGLTDFAVIEEIPQ